MAPLGSLVGPPQDTVLRGLRHRASWAAAFWGDRAGEFPKRFQGGFRNCVKGMLSKKLCSLEIVPICFKYTTPE